MELSICMKILCKKEVYIFNAISGEQLGKSFSKDNIYYAYLIGEEEYYAVNNYNLLELIAENRDLQGDNWFSEYFNVV